MMKIIPIQRRFLEAFVECERGAEEDGMTGPSPLTTVAILSRHVNKIEVQTLEEAAQVMDCCRYGTFPLQHPRVADRIFEVLSYLPGVMEVYRKHDAEEWRAMMALIKGVS